VQTLLNVTNTTVWMNHVNVIDVFTGKTNPLPIASENCGKNDASGCRITLSMADWRLAIHVDPDGEPWENICR
jgi:hypothetical protein